MHFAKWNLQGMQRLNYIIDAISLLQSSNSSFWSIMNYWMQPLNCFESVSQLSDFDNTLHSLFCNSRANRHQICQGVRSTTSCHCTSLLFFDWAILKKWMGGFDANGTAYQSVAYFYWSSNYPRYVIRWKIEGDDGYYLLLSYRVAPVIPSIVQTHFLIAVDVRSQIKGTADCNRLAYCSTRHSRDGWNEYRGKPPAPFSGHRLGCRNVT